MWERLAVLACATLGVAAPICADESAEPATSTARISIRDGVFTEAQAKRGRVAYTGPCNRCHGSKLDGAQDEPDMLPSPPVAGPKFLRRWDGRSLAVLFEYARTTMPANNPGFLTDQEIVDIIAYMLSVGGAPAGAQELAPDLQSLAHIVM